MKLETIVLIATLVLVPLRGWCQDEPSFAGLSSSVAAERSRATALANDAILRSYSAHACARPTERQMRWWRRKLASGVGLRELEAAVFSPRTPAEKRLGAEYAERFGRPHPSSKEGAGSSAKEAAGPGQPPAGPARPSFQPEAGLVAPAGAARSGAAAGPRASAGTVDRKISLPSIPGAFHALEGDLRKGYDAVRHWGTDRAMDAYAAYSRLPMPVKLGISSAIDDVGDGVRWVLEKFGELPPMLEPAAKLIHENGQWLPYQNGIPYPSFERQPERPSLDLAGPWRRERVAVDHKLSLSRRGPETIRALESEGAGRHKVDCNDSGWEELTVPCSDNKMNGPMKEPEKYEDGSWWRRRVDVPAGWKDKFVRLMCLGAGYVADVWINGAYAGGHEGHYTSWALDVTHYLLPGRTNTIAIRLDNVPWGFTSAVLPFQQVDWFNFGGLYRDLYLEASEPACAQDVFVRKATPSGRVEVDALLYNRTLSNRVFRVSARVREAKDSSDEDTLLASDARGLAAGEPVARASAQVAVPALGARFARLTFEVPSPRPWTPSRPDLYVLETVSDAGGWMKDCIWSQFGLRSVEVDPSAPRILLNGEPAPFLAGVARHEDNAEVGRAMTPLILAGDLLKIRDQLHANFIRTAHYANHPFAYLLTDRLGLVAWEEIPFYWVTAPQAYAVLDKRALPLAMWREMVWRDYNRPSIWFWSGANECGAVDPRARHLHAIREDLREHYDDGRLVTQSSAADAPGPFDPSMKECDVAAWTLYFGVGFEARDRKRENLGAAYAGTREFLNNAHKWFPKKPIMASEFGFWANPDGGRAKDQEKYFKDTFRAFRESAARGPAGAVSPDGFVAGATWWTAFDYYTVRTGISTFGAWEADRVTERPLKNAISSAYGEFTGR